MGTPYTYLTSSPIYLDTTLIGHAMLETPPPEDTYLPACTLPPISEHLFRSLQTDSSKDDVGSLLRLMLSIEDHS